MNISSCATPSEHSKGPPIEMRLGQPHLGRGGATATVIRDVVVNWLADKRRTRTSDTPSTNWNFVRRFTSYLL